MEMPEMAIRVQCASVIGVMAMQLSMVSDVTAVNTVLVEAEAFKDRGGWVIDQQFMDEMGSPFLLAHGLGRPVAGLPQPASAPPRG